MISRFRLTAIPLLAAAGILLSSTPSSSPAAAQEIPGDARCLPYLGDLPPPHVDACEWRASLATAARDAAACLPAGRAHGVAYGGNTYAWAETRWTSRCGDELLGVSYSWGGGALADGPDFAARARASATTGCGGDCPAVLARVIAETFWDGEPDSQAGATP